MHAPYWLVLVVISLIAGCATPNVKPFAEQTAALETAVSAEVKATVGKMDDTLALIDMGRNTKSPSTEGTRDDWERWRMQYMTDMAIVTTLLGQAKAYSDAVASLAAAGDTGADAAKSIETSVQGFASTLSNLGELANSLPVDPVSKLSGEVAGRAALVVAQMWTRYQAQGSLREATQEAQPIIQAISDGVDDIFANIQKNIFFSVHRDMRNIQSDVLNTAYAQIYRKHGNSQLINALLDDIASLPHENWRAEYCIQGLTEPSARLRCLGANPKEAKDTDTKAAKAVRAGDAARLEALVAESIAARHRIEFIFRQLGKLDQAKPDFDRLAKAQAEADAWKTERKARAGAIVKATKAWAKAHTDLTAVLAKCSGFLAFKSSCGNLTVANLQHTIERIQYIAHGESTKEQSTTEEQAATPVTPAADGR